MFKRTFLETKNTQMGETITVNQITADRPCTMLELITWLQKEPLKWNCIQYVYASQPGIIRRLGHATIDSDGSLASSSGIYRPNQEITDIREECGACTTACYATLSAENGLPPDGLVPVYCWYDRDDEEPRNWATLTGKKYFDKEGALSDGQRGDPYNYHDEINEAMDAIGYWEMMDSVFSCPEELTFDQLKEQMAAKGFDLILCGQEE